MTAAKSDVTQALQAIARSPATLDEALWRLADAVPELCELQERLLTAKQAHNPDKFVAERAG
jgi:hypothetical protein